LLDSAPGVQLFAVGDDWQAIYRFSYMTVRRSKGMEADYAVVLGLCAGKHGFPVEIADARPVRLRP